MNADDENEKNLSGDQGKPRTEGNEKITTEPKEEEVQYEEQPKFNIIKVKFICKYNSLFGCISNLQQQIHGNKRQNSC